MKGWKIALIGVILLILLSGGYLNFLSIGWTTLSISQASWFSTDTQLNGGGWLLTFVANGGGEHAYGSWSSTDEKFYGLLNKPNWFSVNYDQLEQYVSYPVTTNYENINFVNYVEYDATYNPTITPSQLDAWCYNENQGFMWGQYAYSMKFWCAKYAKYGEAHTFLSGTFNWKGKITVNSMLEEVSGTIDNIGNSIVIPNGVGSNVVWAKWAGNTVSGSDLPTTANVKPVYNFQNQQWRIVNKAAYDSWKSYDLTVVQCLSTKKSDGTDPRFCTNNLNNIVNSIIVATTNDQIFQYATVDITNINQPVIKINVGLLQYPMIQLKIKADFVGIWLPCASISPQFSQIDGTLLGTATQSLRGRAVIKNPGSVDAVFSAKITCPSGIIVTKPVDSTLKDTYEIKAGQSVEITYTHTAAQAVSGQCTITVYDMNCPDVKSSYNYWVDFKRYCAINCGPGTILNEADCTCKCTLLPPTECQQIVSSNPTECHYEQIPGCGSPCLKICIVPWRVNAQCTDCECSLDSTAAPKDYFLNTTACEYQKKQGGGGGMPDWVYIAIILGIAAIAYGLFKRK